MEEAIWYTFDNAVQKGPFTQEQIKSFVLEKSITEETYLYKVGWKDWTPLNQCMAEIMPHALPPLPTGPKLPPLPSRGAPRATIAGRIVVHNNEKLTFGAGVNISSTGIFVESKEQVFNMGEILKLTCNVNEIEKPFQASAKVIRFNVDSKYPVGYGLQFIELDSVIKQKIQSLIDSKNKGS